jgi:hypothetical protein
VLSRLFDPVGIPLLLDEHAGLRSDHGKRLYAFSMLVLCMEQL